MLLLLFKIPPTESSPKTQNQNSNTNSNTNTSKNQNANANTKASNSNNGNASDEQTGTAMSSRDRNFMMDAAMGGMMEVELGRWAAQKGTSAEVKQFGRRMVDDHSRANTELMPNTYVAFL